MTIAEQIAALQEEGRQAFQAQTPIDACPYPRGSYEAMAWREGWMIAARGQLNG